MYRIKIYFKIVATDLSPKIISPNVGENSCDSCYSAVSALLINPLPDRSIILYFATPTTSLWINTSLVSSGQTLYQAASWRLILQSSLLQRFTAESSRELKALRKLSNRQRQVSMFLILLFNLLTQFPFVSFLSISILSLLPFSIHSLPLPHPFFFHQWHIFLHSILHHDIFFD